MARMAGALWRATVVIGLAMAGCVLIADPALAATFPIDEPFSGASPNNPDWVLTDAAKLTNEGDGWLRLTGTGNFEAGTAVLNDAFSTELGVNVEFEYATWGGVELGGHRGDGFSFFLLDGTFPPSIGQSGGGLGYTGIQGGYVGVGFDEFGNFSGGLGGPGQMPDTIALRGSYAANPGWEWLTNAPAPGGSVETGSRAGVRKVRITIDPGGPGETLLSIYSDTGPGTQLEPVIVNFNVATVPGQPPLPATFKLGFSGSTGGATNNHEIRNLSVTVPTDLAITKTGAPSTVDPREQVTYTLTATNNYLNPVSGAIIADTVPAGLTDVTWTCQAGAGAFCDQVSGTGNDISLTAAMEAHTGVTVTVTGTVVDAAAGTTLTNTATVTAPADRTDLNPDDNTSTVDTVVRQFMDLVVDKQLTSSSPIIFGQAADYRITVTNNGPATALGVVVSDTLPPVFSPGSVTAPGCTLAGAVLTCPAGNLAASATRTFQLTATADGDEVACASADVTQTATATGTNADRTPDDATSTVITPCRVPVSLAVTKDGPASALVGGSITYTVTVRNTGGVTAPAVSVSDVVPSEVGSVSWTCAICTPGSGTGNTIAATADIPAGGAAVLVVTGQAGAAGTAVNTVTATPCTRCDGDPVSASASTDLAEPPSGGTMPVTGAPLRIMALTGLGLVAVGLALFRVSPARAGR